MLLVGFGQGPAQADVTAVSGGAYGYFHDVSGGLDPPTEGPTPAVTLPPGGSFNPVTASAAPGSTATGVCTWTGLNHGPITVSTEGLPGQTGSVTSSSSIQNIVGGGRPMQP